MIKKLLFFLSLVLCINVSAQQVSSGKQLTRLLFIFDYSHSMNASWDGSSRISIAKRLITKAIDSLSNVPDLEIALRIYGHQTPLRPDFQDCKDSKLEVPFGKNNHQEIKNKIAYNYPKGTTPIAYSLEQAGGDFPQCKECRNVIILITDGIEACDGDPCAIAKALRSKGVSVKPFIIGVGLDLSYLKQLECIGTVFDAANENSFQNTLKIVIDQAVNNTTAQINLNDITHKPTETNVAYTLYDQKTGKEKYHFMHTMNKYNAPDTVNIDPLSTYRIVVHTIPQVVKENITLKPGVHNIIEVDAPQGFLEIKIKNNPKAFAVIPSIVRLKGEMNTLYVQQINQQEKYLVGNYDLEILTLPRLYINNVSIKQSEVNRVEIPAPGLLRLSYYQNGFASIYVLENGKETFVCNTNAELKAQDIGLLPGKYKIVYRNKKKQKTYYTVEKTFTIQSTQTTSINL